MAWVGEAVAVTTGGPAAVVDAERFLPGPGRQAAGSEVERGARADALAPRCVQAYAAAPERYDGAKVSTCFPRR